MLGTNGIVEPMSQQACWIRCSWKIHQAALHSRRLILAPATMGWITWPKTTRNCMRSLL